VAVRVRRDEAAARGDGGLGVTGDECRLQRQLLGASRRSVSRVASAREGHGLQVRQRLAPPQADRLGQQRGGGRAGGLLGAGDEVLEPGHVDQRRRIQAAVTSLALGWTVRNGSR
jgi:hypothetical protein